MYKRDRAEDDRQSNNGVGGKSRWNRSWESRHLCIRQPLLCFLFRAFALFLLLRVEEKTRVCDGVNVLMDICKSGLSNFIYEPIRWKVRSARKKCGGKFFKRHTYGHTIFSKLYNITVMKSGLNPRK